MVRSADKFHQKILKKLTDLDWMICSMAFKAHYQHVSEKSELGIKINEMLEHYQKYLQTGSSVAKSKLEKDLRIFFPSKTKGVSFKPFSKQTIKVYGGDDDDTPSEQQIYKKKRQELGLASMDDQESAQKDMSQIMSEVMDVMSKNIEKNNLMLNELLTQEAEKRDIQEIRDKEVDNSFGKVYSGIKDIKEAVHELTDIASGNLSYQQRFSTTIVWLLKKLFWGVAKITFSLVKMVFVDTWWVPVKMAGTWIVKKFGRPILIVVGLVLIVQISGIVYMGANLCTDPDYVKDNISVCNSLSENVFFNMAHEFGYIVKTTVWKNDTFVYSSDLGLKLSFNDWTNMPILDFQGKSASEMIRHFLSYTGIAYNYTKGNEAVKAIVKYTARSFISFVWYDLGLHDLMVNVLKEGSKNAVGAVFGETVQNLLY